MQDTAGENWGLEPLVQLQEDAYSWRSEDGLLMDSFLAAPSSSQQQQQQQQQSSATTVAVAKARCGGVERDLRILYSSSIADHNNSNNHNAPTATRTDQHRVVVKKEVKEEEDVEMGGGEYDDAESAATTPKGAGQDMSLPSSPSSTTTTTTATATTARKRASSSSSATTLATTLPTTVAAPVRAKRQGIKRRGLDDDDDYDYDYEHQVKLEPATIPDARRAQSCYAPEKKPRCKGPYQFKNYVPPTQADGRRKRNFSTAHMASHNSTWNLDEHERFLVGLEKFGPGKWKEISEIVESRNGMQVKYHAQHHFRRLARLQQQ